MEKEGVRIMAAKQKIKNKIFNNFTLKILAIISAVILWLVVVNIDDPTVTRTITGIPITIENEEVLSSQNKVYTVTSAQTATILISGKRTTVDNLDADDFEAYAPLDEMSIVNAVPVYVNMKKASLEKEVDISLRTTMITLALEDVTTETYEITFNENGTPAKGYVAGEIRKGKTKIKITAPQSIHDKIDTVAVNIDISDAKEDISGKYKIQLYNANGKEITIDDNITMSSKKVKVSIDMLKTKNVNVIVNVDGTPNSGYEYIDTTYTPQSITILGEPEVVNEVTDIVLPTVNINGARATVQTSIDVMDYLPEGISLYGMDSNYIEVTANIEALVTKSFSIAKDNIEFKNLPEGYEVAFANDKDLTLRLIGLSGTLDTVSEDDIKVSIDLKDAVEGSNTVAVDVELPEGTTQKNDLSVNVKLTKSES
ncbi:MAG: YbbR-like domain-containing protein [Eubacterium sp.]